MSLKDLNCFGCFFRELVRILLHLVGFLHCWCSVCGIVGTDQACVVCSSVGVAEAVCSLHCYLKSINSSCYLQVNQLPVV